MWKRNLLIIGCLGLLKLYGQQIIQNNEINIENNRVIIDRQDYLQQENEFIKIIVEFKDLPQVKQSQSMRRAVNNNLRAAQFSSDLARISEKFSKSLSKNSSQRITVNKEFHKVFSGVQVDVPKKFVPYIDGLNYVKKIYIDGEISINLDESVPLIRADKIWDDFNNKGEGIKISIIDTGIDYMHEALGNGFGTGFKVIKGYDFFNNDSDPMDDNGHGTHVAGIAAANSSSLQGVAPYALLIACKVLNADGNGYSSSIIAAIEFSIDPNNDGDYSDAADIINLSLGGVGTPDDPLSQSVNNATEIGVVVCVAAGNRGGLGFHTIGSPACAEKAITVGNSTKAKQLNLSSSKGPNPIDYIIKPDLLAPGTDIKSSRLLGGVVSYSGTSMATPHIAGVCALLKKQHQQWSPEEIKSALKTTAEIFNYEPMEQGNGFVDAYKSITTGTFVIPSDLSFGRCDTSNLVWTVNKTLKLKNISQSEQQYSVNISSNHTGINFVINNSTFTVASNDSIEINIGIEVNNNLVDFENTGSNSYSGYFQIMGTEDTLSLPWAFIKRQMIELGFDAPYANFSLSSDDKVYYPWDAIWPDLYTAQLNVPGGNYDLISIMQSNDSVYFAVKNNLNLTGDNVIYISRDESKNEVRIEGKNELGNKISELDNFYQAVVVFNENKYANYLVHFDANEKFFCFVSDIPETFLLHCHELSIDEKKSYTVVSHEPVSNLSSDITLTNEPSDMIKQKVKLLYDKNVITPALSYFLDVPFVNSKNQGMGVLDLGTFVYFEGNYWEGYIIKNERISNNPSCKFSLKAINSYPPQNDWGYSFITQPIWVKSERMFMAPSNELTPDIFVEENVYNPLTIGDDILFCRAVYKTGYKYFRQNVYFTGQLGDNRSNGGNIYKYKVYNSENEIIDSGETTILDCFEFYGNIDNLKTEYYHTDHSRFIDSSLAMLTSIINNNGEDKTPPSITSFQIRNSAGKPIDEISEDESIEVRFSLLDPILNEDSVKIEIKDFYKDNWALCNAEKINEHESIGRLFAVNLDSSNYRSIKLLSIRISGEDENANKCEWLLEPAIKINKGNYHSPLLSSISDKTINEDDTLIVDFVCTDLDDDPINYLLTFAQSQMQYEINDSAIKIIPFANWFGTDELSLVASDGKHSDSTKFALTVVPVNDTPSNFQLIYPADEARLVIDKSNESDSLSLSWSESSDVDGDSLKYYLSLYDDSFKIDSIITPKNSYKYPYKNLNNFLVKGGKSNFLIKWNVFVSDGFDTIYADNNNFKLHISGITSGIDGDAIPTDFCLYNAYPNPFNPSTIIKYDIPQLSNIELKMYDLLGREVKTLVSQEKSAGRYEVIFNAKGLSSGIYFYTLRAGTFSQTKKIILLR